LKHGNLLVLSNDKLRARLEQALHFVLSNAIIRITRRAERAETPPSSRFTPRAAISWDQPTARVAPESTRL
jgi:hypothetical protein